MALPRVSFTTTGERVPHNGSHIIINQAYVQYIPPVGPCRRGDGERPVLFVHGGGLTGHMWESTPDRRPGWAVVATRSPYHRPVYVIDAADSGRSQRCPDDLRPASAEHRTAAELWQRFRFGPVGCFDEEDPTKSQSFTDSQFPLEAFEALNASQSARRRGTQQYHAEARALEAAIAEIGTCDVIAHSNGCSVTILALMNGSTRSNIEKFVMIEPGLPHDKNVLDLGVRTLLLWGDHLEHELWSPIRSHYASLKGDVQIWNLPDLGIKGNSHFPMCDRNSDQIIGMILKWLDEM